MGFDRRGISPVIATVLVILVTLVAVTIIWGAIVPLVEDKLESSKACFGLEQVLDITYGCVNITQGLSSYSGDYATYGVYSSDPIHIYDHPFPILDDSSGVCFDDLRAYILLTINRDESDVVLNDIQLSIKGVGAGSSISSTFLQNFALMKESFPLPNEDRVYILEISAPDEPLFPYSGFNWDHFVLSPMRVSIAPIVSFGSGERVCDNSDELEIRVCPSVVEQFAFDECGF
jgi:flagellin-like protein